jgi:hypothetical protein
MKSDAQIGTQPLNVLKVLFEYVYPDEDGDSVEAMLDLATGHLDLKSEIPADVVEPLVRTRIWVVRPDHPLKEGYGEDYPVTYWPDDSTPNWRVSPEDLELISKIHQENHKT